MGLVIRRVVHGNVLEMREGTLRFSHKDQGKIGYEYTMNTSSARHSTVWLMQDIRRSNYHIFYSNLTSIQTLLTGTHIDIPFSTHISKLLMVSRVLVGLDNTFYLKSYHHQTVYLSMDLSSRKIIIGKWYFRSKVNWIFGEYEANSMAAEIKCHHNFIFR